MAALHGLLAVIYLVSMRLNQLLTAKVFGSLFQTAETSQ
jgi:hypothetical protein